MLLGFATESQVAAEAARLVYAVWRSRDVNRLRITPSIWGQVERQVKSCAKRAVTPAEFVEALKPRLSCDAVRIDLLPPEALETGCAADVLRSLYRETGWVVVLVRERLEREREDRAERRALEAHVEGTVEG